MATNDYHSIIQEVVESLPFNNIIDHSVTKELEQTTQLGSWALLNNRWKEIEKTDKVTFDYRSAKEDIAIFGNYMFNESTAKDIIDKLTLFEQINTIDLHTEVIVNQGLNTPGYVMHDKKGKVYDYENRRTEILIRAKYFVRDQILKDPKYLEENAKNIVLLFEGKPEMFASFFKDMNDAIERDCNFKYKDDEKKASELSMKRQVTLVKEVAKVKAMGSKDARIKKIFDNFSDGLELRDQGRNVA